MKKRILALAFAMTLVFGMSLSVSAATSSTSGSTASSAKSSSSSSASEQSEVVSIANNTGQVLNSDTIAWFAEDTGISAGVAGAKIAAVPTDTAKAMITEANRVVGANTFIASIVDLQVPAGTGTATFTLTCSNVWSGQKVSILHLKSDGTYEVITPSNVANNAVTFTMTSYSPIAIVIDTAAPKTGDAGLAAGILAAVLFLTGSVSAAAAYRRKVTA